MRTAAMSVPADEASFEDLLTVFGTRGPASRCYCADGRVWAVTCLFVRGRIHRGQPRAVMRIDFHR